MILESPITTMLSFGGSTSASGNTAQYITTQAEQWLGRLQNSHALGLGAKGVFDELRNIRNQCSSPDWDGYGALPVTDHTFIMALSFLKALPLGIPAPTVGAEPDGQITLEWYRSPRHILSISISPEGDLHYAALQGRRKNYGTEPYWGDVPQIILDLIHQVGSS
ncbi:MAG: hypothetical protein Q8O04_11285 [Deltaproteobacteria bacterium]|nr:hypothetical protein [Deltaproteobacteria bacterium]